MANPTGLEGIQAHLPLGQASDQPTSLDPSVLVSVPRALAREVEGVDASRFHGQDLWNCWEISWLTPSGLPAMRIGQLVVPAASPNLCESKSLKLYLNSFANTVFSDESEVIAQVVADLTAILGVVLRFGSMPLMIRDLQYRRQKGSALMVTCRCGGVRAGCCTLQVDPHRPGQARWHTHLFRSNCPVTSQPDWATVVVKYQAPVRLIEETLLAYLISYRNHTGFHEACIERIYQDLLNALDPTELVVWAGFVRRGGLDINPVRSLRPTKFLPPRLARH